MLKYTPKSKHIQAPDFCLPGVDGQQWTLSDSMGEHGLVVIFICNHCPYVKSIRKQLVIDAYDLKSIGVNLVAIMPNDIDQFPEDSFENMQQVSMDWEFPFPYLLDENQQVAKAFNAVCTPDIFGMNRTGTIKYRGRLNAAGINEPHENLRRDLVEAMQELVETGEIKTEQFPSMGCSIKWKNK